MSGTATPANYHYFLRMKTSLPNLVSTEVADRKGVGSLILCKFHPPMQRNTINKAFAENLPTFTKIAEDPHAADPESHPGIFFHSCGGRHEWSKHAEYKILTSIRDKTGDYTGTYYEYNAEIVQRLQRDAESAELFRTYELQDAMTGGEGGSPGSIQGASSGTGGEAGASSGTGTKRTLDSNAISEEDASKKQRVSPPAETNDELRLMYEKQIEDLKAKHENEMGNILLKYDALIEERTKAAEKIKELNDALRVERTVTDDVDTKISLVRQQNTHLSAKISAMQMERETLMRTMAELQKKPSPAQPQLSNPNTDASEVRLHTPPTSILHAEL